VECDLDGGADACGRNGVTYPDMPWEPKAAFAAVAERYSR
jgi:hypothetical protein